MSQTFIRSDGKETAKCICEAPNSLDSNSSILTCMPVLYPSEVMGYADQMMILKRWHQFEQSGIAMCFPGTGPISGTCFVDKEKQYLYDYFPVVLIIFV